MWRRTYLLLLLVRLWFALSPSYLHPDENFQGPEVIAGETAPSIAVCLHVAPLEPGQAVSATGRAGDTAALEQIAGTSHAD